MERAQLVHGTWAAIGRGDMGALESALAPGARWRAVEDGPWNCEGRAAILEVIARNLGRGLAGTVEDVVEVGADRAIVAFRPSDPAPGGWPLDGGIRYVVITTRDGRIVEIKGCADRATALAFAQSGQGR